jgi:hypothetical protein
VNTNILFYITTVRGVNFMRGKRGGKLRCLYIFSDFYIFWTTTERADGRIKETIRTSRVDDSLKCHRNVSKQTNPLQLGNLITSTAVTVLRASRRIVNTLCVSNFLFLQMWKNSKQHNGTAALYGATRTKRAHVGCYIMDIRTVLIVESRDMYSWCGAWLSTGTVSP